MSSMFDGVTLSITNYSNLLSGWSGQSLENNVTFSGGNSIYNSIVASDRQGIIDNFGWTITDGGEYNNIKSIGDLIYKATIDGSGSVSDALIRLDLTDTNLSNTANAGFISGTSAIKDENNETIAIYDKKITSDGHTYFLFDGDASHSITNNKEYYFVDNKDSNISSMTSYQFNTLDGQIVLDVYSTSGSEERRDTFYFPN